MAETISEKDLENLKEQLNRMPKDKDRIRLIKAAAESFYFTSSQVRQLVDVQHFGDAKNQTAILLHSRLSDPQNFATTVLPAFKFQEDVQEIKEALGV